MPNLWQNRQFFQPCDHQFDRSEMTLKNNREPLLGYFVICASFRRPIAAIGELKLELQSGKAQSGSKW